MHVVLPWRFHSRLASPPSTRPRAKAWQQWASPASPTWVRMRAWRGRARAASARAAPRSASSRRVGASSRAGSGASQRSLQESGAEQCGCIQIVVTSVTSRNNGRGLSLIHI
eukprot:13883510-Alexandrium_andersonii.AAC.2